MWTYSYSSGWSSSKNAEAELPSKHFLTQKHQTSRKLSLWSVPSRGITWSYQNRGSKEAFCMQEHPANQRQDTRRCLDGSGQTRRDLMVINPDSFHLSSFSRFTRKQPSLPWEVLAHDAASCSLDVPLSSRRCSGGDWSFSCEMIFEVIKASRSVRMAALMESRNLSSGLTAAGGAQKGSALGWGGMMVRILFIFILFYFLWHWKYPL